MTKLNQIKIFLSALALSLVIVSCNNDKAGMDHTGTGEVEPAAGNEMVETPSSTTGDSVDASTQPMNEDNTGLMPKINTSFYGKNKSNAEVSLNFLPDNKFEMFTIKGSDEKLITGTYSEKNGEIELHPSTGANIMLKKTGDNAYAVVENGANQYTLTIIQ